eukprot:5632056-Prorocentrum_lima.AAC.1
MTLVLSPSAGSPSAAQMVRRCNGCMLATFSRTVWTTRSGLAVYSRCAMRGIAQTCRELSLIHI